MHIQVDKVDLSRVDLPWAQRWKGPDHGLIACWERGKEKATESEALASAARRGELVVLPWKGGVERPTKQRVKYGSLYYLAMWQGLRGDPLDIDTEKDVAITCTRTEMLVIYTDDASKYTQQSDRE